MSLIKIIKKIPELRSIFGERELKIIEKQLLGIRLSPSEKTRLSRDIRKKFRAIKALANYADEKELKFGKEIKEQIEETKDAIIQSKYFHDIKKIILFGSTVENIRTFRSDIDIAVEFFDVKRINATRFRLDIVKNIPEKIDIQVYNILPEKIKKEIDLKGRILWKNENK